MNTIGAFPTSTTTQSSDGTQGHRIRLLNNGLVAFSFLTGGTWYQRLGLDVQNRRIILDDPESANAMEIARSPGMPTSGSYSIGSFVFNTNPTVQSGKVLLGWSRLTTGSNHVLGIDWIPIYGTTS